MRPIAKIAVAFPPGKGATRNPQFDLCRREHDGVPQCGCQFNLETILTNEEFERELVIESCCLRLQTWKRPLTRYEFPLSHVYPRDGGVVPFDEIVLGSQKNLHVWLIFFRWIDGELPERMTGILSLAVRGHSPVWRRLPVSVRLAEIYQEVPPR